MKILRTVSVSLVVLLLFMANFPTKAADSLEVTSNTNGSTSITYLKSNDSYEIKNLEAKSIYEKLLGNVSNRKAKSSEPNESGLEMLSELSKSEYELEHIYTFNSEVVSDSIVRDNNSNTYVLIEVDYINETTLVSIDGQALNLNIDEGENIFLQDLNGEKLEVVETIFDDNYVSNDTEITPMAKGYWGNNFGPRHKTNKMSFTVLGIISTIAGVLTLRVEQMIIGIALILYDVAVQVGQTITPIVHIKYYTQYMSDCQTYVRETRYYYGAYSEITKTFYEPITDTSGVQKRTYHTWHSVNPDYVGGACTSY